MKKFILFSILSVLFCSAPGHTSGRGNGSNKEMAKALVAAEEAREEEEREKRRRAAEERRKLVEAAAEEARSERQKALAALHRQAAAASLAAALAEATVVKREAAAERAASLAAALAAAEAAETAFAAAPATEVAPTRATSVERQLGVCAGSLARTALAHAQGAMSVLQGREDALREHFQRIRAMATAAFRRGIHYPLDRMMSEKEKAEDAGLRRMEDIIAHAFSIRETLCRQVEFSLAGLARDKELVSTIIQKAAGLRSAEAAVQEALPVEAAEEAVLRDLAAAERAEAQKVEKLRVLCKKIADNRNKLPPDIPRQEVVDLSKEALSEIEGTLDKMDIERLKMWRKEIDYCKKVLGLSAMARNSAEEANKTVTGCFGALFGQATKEGSYAPESTGTSIDPGALLGRCTDLLSDIDNFREGTVQKSSEYIAFSQEKFDALRKRGGSLVEAYLDLEYEEEAEGPETTNCCASSAASRR